MVDSLITCPRCTSDACFENINGDTKMWYCFGCGFNSSTFRHKEKVNYEEVEELIPNLHKDLRFIDDEGFIWYPTTINDPEKGMVFADGTSISNWKWASVLCVEGKPDMSTIQYFDERDYIDALDYMGYFNK